MVGLSFLVVAGTLGDFVSSAMKGERLGELLREGLVICGWVAMRRPFRDSPVRLVADPHGGPTLRSTERHAGADRVQGECRAGSVAPRLAGGAACANHAGEIAAACFIAPRQQ
jgi:hypothetical protein